MITQQTVLDVAKLSRLQIEDGQVNVLAEQMSGILDYMEVLNSLDTQGVEPLAHVMPMKNVYRDDNTRPSLANAQAMKLAPDSDGEYFRVPKVVAG